MKTFLIFLSTLFYTVILSAQVGIGEVSPDASSAIEVNSVSSGVLFPRMTTMLRDAISNPAKSLLIYNTDSNEFQYNIGTSLAPVWVLIDSKKHQSGTYSIGATSTGWNYYNVTFATEFASTPAICISYREGTGVDETASHTAAHLKVANATPSGFTIGIRDSSTSNDVFIDWKAVLKTQ